MINPSCVAFRWIIYEQLYISRSCGCAAKYVFGYKLIEKRLLNNINIIYVENRGTVNESFYKKT